MNAQDGAAEQARRQAEVRRAELEYVRLRDELRKWITESGAPVRRHGRCTCRNNPAWPSCSLCTDFVPCWGCEYCHPNYHLDLNNETAKGAPCP